MVIDGYAEGTRLNYTNAGATALAANTPVVVGALVGVTVTDIAAGATGALSIHGVHKLAKPAGIALAQGVKVGWDDTGKTVVAAGGTPADFGYVYDAVDAAATEVPVLINR